jgi:hypothetical protein
MSKIYYGADGKRLIPAPLVTIEKSYQKTGDGEIVGKLYNITLNGSIIAWMGSPLSNGTFHIGSSYPDDEIIDTNDRLAAIQRKQEAIRHLFSTEGQNLEIQTTSGLTSVRCYPRILGINFEQGIWHDRCNYSISLECDELYGGLFSEEDTFDQYVSNISESWTIDTNEEHAEKLGVPKTYILSHNLSANGKRFYDNFGNLTKPAWEQAKNWVVSKLGINSSVVQSVNVLNLPSYYQGYNHSRNENIDQNNGSYSVTETWILSSGTSTENFSVKTIKTLEDPYVVVNIEGTITGYDQADSNLNVVKDKWTNAKEKLNFVSGVAFTRAQYFSNENLNIVPRNELFGFNPIQGTITYDFEFDNRPINLIDGVKRETIAVNDQVGGEKFAAVFVLGRTKGPVLQGLGTKEANVRSLNIELLVDPPTYSDRSVSTIKDVLLNKNPFYDSTYSLGINNVINAVNPANNGFSSVYQDQPQINWDAKNGLFSYNCNWTYE